MKKIDILRETYPDEALLQADGFDDAILGIVCDLNSEIRVAYSRKKCLEILTNDMDLEDAMEYFDFNVQGAYVGEKTPVWIDDIAFQEWE